MSRLDFHKVVIGRSEPLHLVDFAMNDIPAKVDTGAYRSAIHADNIQLSNDGKTLSFRLLGGHPICGNLAKTMVVDTFQKVNIENSFGQREERFEIKLRVKLGPKIFRATFSLADRGKKVYPVLIGRKMLNGRFLVDTDRSWIDRAELKRLYGVGLPNDEEGRAQ